MTATASNRSQRCRERRPHFLEGYWQLLKYKDVCQWLMWPVCVFPGKAKLLLLLFACIIISIFDVVVFESDIFSNAPSPIRQAPRSDTVRWWVLFQRVVLLRRSRAPPVDKKALSDDPAPRLGDRQPAMANSPLRTLYPLCLGCSTL